MKFRLLGTLLCFQAEQLEYVCLERCRFSDLVEGDVGFVLSCTAPIAAACAEVFYERLKALDGPSVRGHAGGFFSFGGL